MGVRRRLTIWLAVLATIEPACSSDDPTPRDAGEPGVDAADASVDADANGVDGSRVDDGAIVAAPDGTGTNCTVAAPCSLLDAQARAREVIPTMTQDVVVRLRGGRYELAATFELDGRDSGTGGHRVVYEAFPGEQPVLSGGALIFGFTHEAPTNVHSASVPPGLATRQVYVGGVRAQRARGPSGPAGWVETPAGYTAPDAPGWANPSGVEVVSFVYWKAFRCGVASVDGSTVTMDEPCWSLAQWHTPFDMALPAWVENARELLDEEGEWYLDEDAARLSYMPRRGEDPTALVAEVPRLETLVRVAGTRDAPVDDLVLRGLGFAASGWLEPSSPHGYPVLQAGFRLQSVSAPQDVLAPPGAVVLSHARDVVVERCTFERLGALGLVVEEGSQRIVIEGNRFRDLSGGAIAIGGVLPADRAEADPARLTSDHVVRNNYITDVGLEYFDHAAIFVGYARGVIIEHNELANLPWVGIHVGWGWDPTVVAALGDNRVTHNLVRNSHQRLEDGGLVYTLSAQPGSAIAGNYLHDQARDFAGIYLDQGTRYYSVTNNVVSSAPHWLFVQHCASTDVTDNTVTGNHADVTTSFCCCGDTMCCPAATAVNDVSSNAIHGPGGWPPEALAIIEGAGIEAAYATVRPTAFRVEAEDYRRGGEGVGYHDLTPGNGGGAYRRDDVDVYDGDDRPFSNGATVGWTETGEWLAYNVDVAETGVYRFRFRIATDRSLGPPPLRIALEVDGVPAGGVDLPDTGGFDAIDEATLADVALVRGPHVVTTRFTGGFNFDAFWYELTAR